jgi:ketosteroid isomerase-like protein
MSQANVELVRRVYDAAARRDANAVLALYDPDVEWDWTRVSGLFGRAASTVGTRTSGAGFANGARDWTTSSTRRRN